MTHTLNVADLFETVADIAPERKALALSDGTTYSYKQMDERANRCGHMLSSLGVEAGDRVAIVARNRVEWLDVLLGCFKIRAMAVNVNYRYTAREIAHVLDDCEAAVVIVEAEFADTVLDGVEKLSRRGQVLVVDGEARQGIESAACYPTLLALEAPTRGFPERSGNDGYLLYTGGTTGLPKGVYWTHECLIQGALSGGVSTGQLISDAVNAQWDQRPAVASMAVAPLMHGNGQWAVLRAWASAGTAVVWAGKTFDAARVWGTVESFEVAIMSVVGDAMASPLVEELQRDSNRWDLSSLVAFGSGGAVLSAPVKDRLRKALPDVQIIDGYGGSEVGNLGTSGHASNENPPRFQVRPGVAVLTNDLTEAAVGEVGIVAVSGATASAYWGDDAKTAEVFRTGSDGRRWAVIGDNGTLNQDGTITLLGRGSLVVNTGGEKVFPDEVESVIKEHPAIADSLVVGVADSLLGEHVAAVVSVRTGDTVDLTALQAFARQRLAGYKIPRTLVVVDEIRRSPAGKADYSWARKIANANIAD